MLGRVVLLLLLLHRGWTSQSWHPQGRPLRSLCLRLRCPLRQPSLAESGGSRLMQAAEASHSFMEPAPVFSSVAALHLGQAHPALGKHGLEAVCRDALGRL